MPQRTRRPIAAGHHRWKGRSSCDCPRVTHQRDRSHTITIDHVPSHRSSTVDQGLRCVLLNVRYGPIATKRRSAAK